MMFYERMLTALDTIATWCEEQPLQVRSIIPNKTKMVFLNAILSFAENAKYLIVTIQNRLTWDSQITKK